MLFNRFLRILKANMLTRESQQAQLGETEYTKSHTHNSNQQQKQQHSASSTAQKQEKAFYQALEVTPGASFEEIKAAYKKLVKKYHPDLFHNNSEKRRYAEIVTQRINEAYAYFEQNKDMR